MCVVSDHSIGQVDSGSQTYGAMRKKIVLNTDIARTDEREIIYEALRDSRDTHSLHERDSDNGTHG